MFAWKKIINKGSNQANTAPPPEKVTYPLETIMALQKSLEHGFDVFSPGSTADHDANMAALSGQPGLAPLFIGIKRFLRWLFLPRVTGISKKEKGGIKKPVRTAQPSS